jgi:hypothetical protein
LNNAPLVSNRTASQKYQVDNVIFPPAVIFGHFIEEIGLTSRNFHELIIKRAPCDEWFDYVNTSVATSS